MIKGSNLNKLFIVTLFMAIFQTVNANNSSAPVVRDFILQQLQQAQQYIEAEQYLKSQQLLTELTNGNLSQYEYSQVYSLLATQYYQQDKNGEAIAQYEKILELKQLPEFTIQQTRYNLSQLYFLQEDYLSARRVLQHWFELTKSKSADALELLAQINFRLNQYESAIEAINNAINLYRNEQKIPRQSWLQLLYHMYYEMQNTQATLGILEQLVHFYPKKIYWLQLAGVYAELGLSERQLSVLDAAYLQGLLQSEIELKTLANLYLQQKAPFKAASILRKGLESNAIAKTERNMKLASHAWRLAKEIDQAGEAMKLAAKLSGDGYLYAELGQLYLLDEQYTQAITACQLAINKGSLKKPGLAYNTLGIALFKRGDTLAALKAFREAENYPSTSKLAQQWLSHLQNLDISQ